MRTLFNWHHKIVSSFDYNFSHCREIKSVTLTRCNRDASVGSDIGLRIARQLLCCAMSGSVVYSETAFMLHTFKKNVLALSIAQ